jgi:hypothetical protein
MTTTTKDSRRGQGRARLDTRMWYVFFSLQIIYILLMLIYMYMYELHHNGFNLHRHHLCTLATNTE